MGYKQQNNPFSKKISSPLKHNVTNAAGETWRHSHRNDGRTISLEAKNITGSSKFGKKPNRAAISAETNTKRLSEERGGGRATEKNLAMDYANQIADMYNRGELVGGQFLADDFYKRKSKLSLKNNKLKIKPRFKSIGDAKRYNVQYADEMEGFDKEAGYQAAETQYTPEEIYEMMVQGGGMVSIVDGKIVAGNPNEVKYNLTDEDYENARLGGTSRYKTSYEDANYTPEGFTSDERSNEPKKKYTVRELLEQRKQRNNSAINRVMSNSPLNQGHETDERSEQTFNLQEGYNYQDPVVTETVGEWVDDPNNPGQQMRVITWPELKEAICSGKMEGNTNICDDVQTISNSVTEYRNIDNGSTTETEEEITTTEVEETPQDPVFEFDLGSGRKKKKGFDIKLPEVNLPSLGLDELNILKKKCGGCRQRGLIQRAILALGGGI